MKRIVSAILLLLLIGTMFALPGSAATVGKVRDDTGLLSSDQISALNDKRLSLIESGYAFDMRVAFVPISGISDMQAYADDLYERAGYGAGAEKEGMLLVFFTDGVTSDGAPYIYDYTLIISGPRQEVFFADDGKYGEWLTGAIVEALDPDTLSIDSGDMLTRYAKAINAFIYQTQRILLASGATAATTAAPITAAPANGNAAGNSSTGAGRNGGTGAAATAVPTNVPTTQTRSLLPAGTDTSYYVMDTAGLLTASQVESLNSRAAAIAGKYGCDPLIVTVQSLNGYSVEAFSEALLNQYGLGQGNRQSCVMLLVAMGSRDYDLMAHGYGNTAFTDYGKDAMTRDFVPYLSAGRYDSAFGLYLDDCEQLLQMAQEGTPFDYNTDPDVLEAQRRTHRVTGIALGVGLPALIAFIACGSMKSQMKTVRKQTTAGRYVAQDGLQLTRKVDQFLRTTTSRTRVVTQSSSGGGRSGGGGGTHVNSGGFSHHSGKF